MTTFTYVKLKKFDGQTKVTNIELLHIYHYFRAKMYEMMDRPTNYYHTSTNYYTAMILMDFVNLFSDVDVILL